MESAIQTIVKVFLKSTKGKESLGQSQLQGLVKSQLSNILSDTDSKEAVKNMGKGLDANHDGKVGFEEYLKLVGYLATSLSEQRNLAQEEPAQKAASGLEAQTSPDKEAEKPKANAEAKDEVKPGESSAAKEEAKSEENAKAKVEAKPEANTEAKIAAIAEIKVKENVGESVVKKLQGETKPEAAAEEEKKAMAGGAVLNDLSEMPLPVCSKSEEVIDVAKKVEKVVAAAEEEVEKKVEEATSLAKKE
ncbi:uncharacterized protein ACO6RY_01408 [Pungitius sinensis]